MGEGGAMKKKYFERDTGKTMDEAKAKKRRRLPHAVSTLKAAREACTIPSLRELALKKLDEIPEEIADLQQLEHLRLEQCKITALPSVIGKLVKLRTLRVESEADVQTKLTEVSESICDLASLEELVLSGHALTSLPEGIGRLAKLRVLNVDSNAISQLPESLYSIGTLTELHANFNRLEHLSEDFSGMSSLTKIHLMGNAFTEFPRGFQTAPALHTISFQHNQVSHFAADIGLPRLLRILKLSVNPLEHFPEVFTRSETLEELYLGHTQIDSIPDEIVGLRRLTFLDLSRGKRNTALGIRQIPPALCELPNLSELALAYHSLQELPPELAGMRSLAMLDLRGNALSIPAEILDQGKNAIFEHLAWLGPPDVDVAPSADERREVRKKYKPRVNKYIKRVCYDEKKRSRDDEFKLYAKQDPELNAILSYALADTDEVPRPSRSSRRAFTTYNSLIDVVFRRYQLWTFVERRMMRVMTHPDVWHYTKHGLPSPLGYHEQFLLWLREEVRKEEQGSKAVFAEVIEMLESLGVDGDIFLGLALKDMSHLLIQKGKDSSLGRYLLACLDTKTETIRAVIDSDGDAKEYIGIFLTEHAPKSLGPLGLLPGDRSY